MVHDFKNCVRPVRTDTVQVPSVIPGACWARRRRCVVLFLVRVALASPQKARILAKYFPSAQCSMAVAAAGERGTERSSSSPHDECHHATKSA